MTLDGIPRFAVTVVLVLAIAGCTPVPVPDLCHMPPRFRSWDGGEVEWSGIVLGGPHHGRSLACERRRGAIGLDWEDDLIGRAAFEEMLNRRDFEPGLLRITVRGRLGRSTSSGWPLNEPDAPVLRIRAVRAMEFVPMTYAEETAYFEARQR